MPLQTLERPILGRGSLARWALACVLLSAVLRPVAAEEDLSSPQFDSLYQGSMTEERAAEGLDLNLDAAVDAVAVEVAEPQAGHGTDERFQEGAAAGGPGEEQGSWKVAPIMPQRSTDEETTLVEELTPVGLGFVREF